MTPLFSCDIVIVLGRPIGRSIDEKPHRCIGVVFLCFPALPLAKLSSPWYNDEKSPKE